MTRNDDHGHFRHIALDRFEDINPIHMAVFKPNIEDDQRGQLLLQLRHAFIGISRHARGKPLILQNVANQFANITLIIDNKYISHEYPSFSQSLTAGGSPPALLDARHPQMAAHLSILGLRHVLRLFFSQSAGQAPSPSHGW